MSLPRRVVLPVTKQVLTRAAGTLPYYGTRRTSLPARPRARGRRPKHVPPHNNYVGRNRFALLSEVLYPFEDRISHHRVFEAPTTASARGPDRACRRGRPGAIVGKALAARASRPAEPFRSHGRSRGRSTRSPAKILRKDVSRMSRWSIALVRVDAHRRRRRRAHVPASHKGVVLLRAHGIQLRAVTAQLAASSSSRLRTRAAAQPVPDFGATASVRSTVAGTRPRRGPLPAPGPPMTQPLARLASTCWRQRRMTGCCSGMC